jgi:catechol 2,3-dioxygenase-like lactoylglutathione lyase family enzyme
VQMRLEVVVIPVSDVDRAKEFYERLGWRLDADVVTSDDFRVIQLTPPGSPCSIIFGTGITTAAPGSADGLYLVVDDIEAARAELIEHGVQVSEVFHDAGGVFHHAGTTARLPGPDPIRTSYASFASFNDPDGNGWMLQEVTTRLPGRCHDSPMNSGSCADLIDDRGGAARKSGRRRQLLTILKNSCLLGIGCSQD